MESNKYAGILIIILGLIFMCFPVFSSVVFSVIIGVSLLFLGIATVLLGCDMIHENGSLAALTILIGIIGIILGILFAFYIDAVAVLVSLEFYILGFIMILFGICGLFAKNDGKAKIMALLIIILGIVAVLIAVFALAEPIYIAIIVGIVLVMEGILLLFDD